MGDLDFWIGEWDCTWEGGRGTNTVARELGGAVVVERFEAFGPEPFTGMSVSVPDPLSGAWRQTWADSDGNYWAFTGGPRGDGTFVFQTDGPVDAERLHKRMVFSEIAADGFVWRWEASPDGETWTERWTIRYRRRGASDGTAPLPEAVLETSRLRLRELVPEDEVPLAALFADPEVMRWIGTGGVRTREDARRVIERELAGYRELGYGDWATTLRGSDELIGLCGVLRWPDLDGREEIEVAYLLGRAWWGRGFATEAATAIRDWARHTLDRERLVCLVYHDNVASAAVARKLGMAWDKDVSLGEETVAMYALPVA
ncbi:MAG: GNAT family N-acetyltransferase [Actinomycetota bacterium]